MQTRARTNRCALTLLIAGLIMGCVKEISSEERLEREITPAPNKKVLTGDELKKVNCDDTPQGLVKARNVNSPEDERVASYIDLYQSLKSRSEMFEDAMSRNPDLAYQEGSQALVTARDMCIQQTADVRVEFDRYVRELVDVPTVQEVKGGSTVTIARLDFETLREAIEALNPDDKDQLLSRVAAAEKKIENMPKTPSKRRKK